MVLSTASDEVCSLHTDMSDLKTSISLFHSKFSHHLQNHLEAINQYFDSKIDNIMTEQFSATFMPDISKSINQMQTAQLAATGKLFNKSLSKKLKETEKTKSQSRKCHRDSYLHQDQQHRVPTLLTQ